MSITRKNYDELLSIVEQHAKFQKVMLIFDNFTSNLTLQNIQNQIKEVCIFNKMPISSTNINEVYNGYKMLIFCCEPECFLKLNLNLSEFVCVVINNSAYLPFTVDTNNNISETNMIILPNKSSLDKPAFASLYFNEFYNYICNLYTQQDDNFTLQISEFSPRQLINVLNSLPANFTFVDVDILRKSNLNYDCLPLIDFCLITGFETLFSCIKQHNLEMTDLYKSIRADQQLIDKFYALAQNDALLAIVELNYDELTSKIKRAKKQILGFMPTFTTETLKKVVEQVKAYAKNTSSIINYMFLYNVFNI